MLNKSICVHWPKFRLFNGTQVVAFEPITDKNVMELVNVIGPLTSFDFLLWCFESYVHRVLRTYNVERLFGRLFLECVTDPLPWT
jgi:hypothetical protein